MSLNFIHTNFPIRTKFEAGAVKKGTSVLFELNLLKVKRALILTSPSKRQKEKAEHLERLLGETTVGIWPKALQHVQMESVKEALKKVKSENVDCLLTYGGGSCIGLAKAINLYLDEPIKIVHIPTTYSGSEMTDIYGITEGGKKEVGKSQKIIANTVIYDIEETYSMGKEISTLSALNAMAHAVEALYSDDRTPISDSISGRSLNFLKNGLDLIFENGLQNKEGRYMLFVGSWLSAVALGSVSMGLHHKLAHVVGGDYNLDHMQVHSALLPHTLAYNLDSIPEPFKIMQDAFGTKDVCAEIYNIGKRGNGKMNLSELGLREENIPKIVESIMAKKFSNPKIIHPEGVRKILTDAFYGKKPQIMLKHKL